jgi:adenylyltransferase/sulfurtransferase
LDCPCCVAREFPFLAAAPARQAVGLCGRNAVQVQSRAAGPDLAALERTLAGVARAIDRRGAVLRFEAEGQRFTVFADGRALIEGTDDEGVALALYDRYVGS